MPRKSLDEEESRNREKRLGKAREDAPARRGAHRDAPRDEYEADREPFGDVVHCDGDRDENPERLASAEGGADADAFSDRVHRHDGHDEQRLDRVVAAERPKS